MRLRDSPMRLRDSAMRESRVRLRAAFVALVGAAAWATRLAELRSRAATGPRAASAIRRRHAIELTIAGFGRADAPPPSPVAARIAQLTAALLALAEELPADGQQRLVAVLHAALRDDGSLVPLFHLLRTADRQRSRGFAVHHAGLADAAPFDLLLTRDGAAAELACDTVSAEDGRDLHRSAWARLADRIDPRLRGWLAATPGCYLLRLTLPQGLRGPAWGDAADAALLPLQDRIMAMLAQGRRREDDAAAVLRLDALPPAAPPSEPALLAQLRGAFGPEAHLSVTIDEAGLFAMAARATRENSVAAVIRQRMAALAPARLTGTLPGLLAICVEDTDRGAWRALHERVELECEARQFLTWPEARPVVAVTIASRFALFGDAEAADAAEEVRYRNPAHPAAGLAALAPAVLSSV